MNTLERYDALQDRYIHMAKRNNLTEPTISNYTKTLKLLRSFLQERTERCIIGEDYVSYDDIQAWIDRMSDLGNKSSTIKKRLVHANQFFTFACKPYIPENLRYNQSPVSPDFYPKVIAEPIEDKLTNDNIIDLWKYEKKYQTSDVQFARNYCLIVLMLCTGLRNKEVLDLYLSDYDEQFKELRVRCGKGRKSRIVDLPDLAIEAINNYLNTGLRPSNLSDDDFLFGTTASHEFGVPQNVTGALPYHRGTTEWLSSLVSRHVEHQTNGDVIGCRSHALRHAFARLQLNATGNLAELQSLMGHSSPVMTERYSHRLMERRRREDALRVIAARDEAAEKLRIKNQHEQKTIPMFA